ncbi:MAG: thioredoxin-dependent thiol peroxidase [Bacteroidetes bacterium]|nr:thioredoxin-dependent thiol peroxidase [Bacteroidota bacterium]
MTILKIGNKAPDFKVKNQDGNEVSLKDFKGKKLVLYFYPQANTPTCTIESCNLSDNYKQLQKAGYEVVGVSPDSEKKQAGFKSKFKLPFDLLADTEHDLVKAYDVWGEKKTFGKTYMGLKRTTFIISEKGLIEDIIEKVEAKEHTKQILK